MGCIQTNRQKIIISQNDDLKNVIKKSKFINNKKSKKIKKNDYIHKITYKNWVKIIDFLNFIDIKETGKVNLFFNKIVKDKNILLKFFQNRGDYENKFIPVEIDSKNNNILDIFSTKISYKNINNFHKIHLFSTIKNDDDNNENLLYNNNNNSSLLLNI